MNSETGAEFSPPPLPPMGFSTLVRAASKRVSNRALAQSGLKSAFVLTSLPEAHVAAYRAEFDWRGSRLPPTYLYLLAQRAQLATMLQPAFGYRVAGMVHVANTIEMVREPAPGTEVCVATHVREEPPSASGAIFLTFEVTFSDASGPFATCRCRYLARRGRSGTSSKSAANEPVPANWPAIAAWSLSSRSGRRYAGVSGDYNPIHLSRMSARLFGFKRPIIQGMHTVAKCASEIAWHTNREVMSVSVSFLKPVPLGSNVTLRFDDATRAFEWSAGQTVCGTGSLTFAAAGGSQ